MNMKPQHNHGAYMRDTLAALKALAEAQNASTPAQLHPAPLKSSLITTEERYRTALTQWITSMNPLQRTQPYTIKQVIRLSGLTGEGNKKASVQLVGSLLYELGFSAKRWYVRGARNARYWTLTTE